MTPPYAGTHTESRFVREIQQESSNNVALHFRASAPSAPTKSIAYVTRPRTKCRRWVKQHRARRRELGARPGVDFGELVLVHIAESEIEVAGVLLPGPNLGQRSER